MSKLVRNLLLLVAALVIVGGIIGGIGLALGGMKPISLTKDGLVILSTDSADSVEINESYTKLTEVHVNLKLGELKLVEGDSFSLRGRYNSAVQSFEITERNGVLTIVETSRRSGFFDWGFDLGLDLGSGLWSSDALTLTYPKGTTFTNVDVTLDLGSLNVQTLRADSMSVRLSMGDFTGNKITVDSIDANMELGNCVVSDLTVTKQAEFTLSSGNLNLNNSSVYNLTLKNSMGNLEYSGVLKGTATCDLDLGSVTMDLENREDDLSYRIETDLGSVSVNGQRQGSSVSRSSSSPACTLEIRAAMGSVDLNTR